MDKPAAAGMGAESSKDPWEVFPQMIQTELEQNRRSLKEVTLMLEQSQAELAKLTQRNAAVNSHLQQIQAQFDSVPRSDIRNAYTSALDVQQRLLVMRGQLEKLQSDQNNLKRFSKLLEDTQIFLSEQGGSGKGGGRVRGNAVETLEMIVKGQEAIRQRLSTQIHNGPAQALTNFILQLDIASRYFDVDKEKAKEELNNLRLSAMASFQQVKLFISELRPMMLDDLGLLPTLQKYIKDFNDQGSAEATLTIKGQERRLDPYLEVMVFRAVQELLGNAVRHNQDLPAKLMINVMVLVDDNLMRITVTDNGKGFDPEATKQGNGLGLKLIRDRVELLGGYLEIDSAVGKGAKIIFQIPCLENHA